MISKIETSLLGFLLAMSFLVPHPSFANENCGDVFSKKSGLLKNIKADLGEKSGIEILSDLFSTPKQAQVTENSGEVYPADIQISKSGGMRTNFIFQIVPTDGRMSLNIDKSYSLFPADVAVVDNKPLFDGDLSQSTIFRLFQLENISSFARIDSIPLQLKSGDSAQQFLLGFNSTGELKIIYVLQATQMPFGGDLKMTSQGSSFRRIELK